MLPHDPFNRARLPPTFDRQGRLRLLAEVFDSLVAGRMPSREAAAFVGAAGLDWLAAGGGTGSLERDYFGVAPPRASTLTASKLWGRLQAEGSSGRATPTDTDGTMATSTST